MKVRSAATPMAYDKNGVVFDGYFAKFRIDKNPFIAAKWKVDEVDENGDK